MMSESQHSTADWGMSENSVGSGLRLTEGIGGCVGGGVLEGQSGVVGSLVTVSVDLSASYITIGPGHQSGDLPKFGVFQSRVNSSTLERPP